MKLLRCISGTVTVVSTVDNIGVDGAYTVVGLRAVTNGNGITLYPLTNVNNDTAVPNRQLSYNAGTTGARGSKHGILIAPVTTNQGNATDTWKVTIP